jgi:hypothetical protein
MVAVGAVACADQPTIVAPDVANFELVEIGDRVAAGEVNAHVYGSFSNLSFDYTVGTAGGFGPIESGIATGFPGNPKNAGTCDMGLWLNPQERRTSGSMAKPHPHCVGPIAGTEEEKSMVVVLEPISAKFTSSEDRTSGQTWQRSLTLGNGLIAEVEGQTKTKASGEIVAYAIDASTLNDASPVRVGTLTFDLGDYASESDNYFEKECTLGGWENAPRCLALVIDAVFTPSAAFADKLVTRDVTGFLYWTSAEAPFNYDND